MKTLDRFILREVMSDSAAGTVYKAEEMLPGENRRMVALKVFAPIDPSDRVGQERFFGEIRVLAQLTVQPHVVTIYAMGLTEGYPWLAMELGGATALGKMTEEPGNVAEVVKFLQQVGSGLGAIHRLNPPLVHQDIKPANILVDAGGNYKITDFSLATAVAANRTHGLATVRYAAPELLSSEFGRVSPATDLYSLGHVAYEMALGGRLHRAQFPAVFEGNTTREPPPNKWMMWHASGNTRPAGVHEVRKDFPAGVGEVIARLMAKSMSERYVSAEEMLADLERAREGVQARQTVAVGPSMVTAPSAPPPITAMPSEQMPHAASAPVAAPAPMMPEVPVASVPPMVGRAGAGSAPGGVKYWVRLRGRVSGPFDVATLQRQIRQGQLSRLHQLSADQVTWKSASEVEGLYGPTVV